MNRTKEISDSNLKEFFTIETTKTFQIDLDQALKAMELMEVMKVLIKYNIILKPEAKEFLTAYGEMMEGWEKQHQRSIVVNEVTTSGSRCIACEYGRGMTVYEFHYKHSEAEEPFNRVIYSYDFGMMYNIREGILHDIAICNAFLSKAELQQLK